MSRRWTNEEIDILKEKYGWFSDENIAESLNRTVISIALKAQKENIKKSDNGELITVTDFCLYTGISRSSVEYWINNVGFPTRKIGKYRKISSIEFWKWAEGNKQRIVWNDFPVNIISGEPEWVIECRRKNVKRIGKRRKWTSREINELKRLLKQEKYNYLELSELLNRSHSAIKRKIYDLNLLYTPITTNNQNYYTDEELKNAIKQLENGIELVVVARELNRSELGLRGKLERIGYL